jgi:hypothetical protein
MSDRLLLTKDAAEYCNVSNGYLLNQAKMGRVAYIQPSPKKIMFSKPDLDTWMAGWLKVSVNIKTQGKA